MTSLINDCVYQNAYRIYLEDTDAGGIVYHANHLKLFERCRRDWLRSLGMQSYFYQSASVDETTLSSKSHLQFVISDANVRYLKPILLDSMVTVTVSHVQAKSASLLLDQRIYIEYDDKIELLSQGKLTLVCVSTVHNKGRTEVRPTRLPAEFIKILNQAPIP